MERGSSVEVHFQAWGPAPSVLPGVKVAAAAAPAAATYSPASAAAAPAAATAMDTVAGGHMSTGTHVAYRKGTGGLLPYVMSAV